MQAKSKRFEITQMTIYHHQDQTTLFLEPNGTFKLLYSQSSSQLEGRNGEVKDEIEGQQMTDERYSANNDDEKSAGLLKPESLGNLHVGTYSVAKQTKAGKVVLSMSACCNIQFTLQFQDTDRTEIRLIGLPSWNSDTPLLLTTLKDLCRQRGDVTKQIAKPTFNPNCKFHTQAATLHQQQQAITHINIYKLSLLQGQYICYLLSNQTKYNYYQKKFKLQYKDKLYCIEGDAPGVPFKINDGMLPGYKIYLKPGEEIFFYYKASVEKPQLDYPFNFVRANGDDETDYNIQTKYHELTPLIVCPTREDKEMLSLIESEYPRLQTVFKGKNRVTVKFSEFESSKEEHEDVYYCVIIALLDDGLKADDLKKMKEFFRHYTRAPIVAWVVRDTLFQQMISLIPPKHHVFPFRGGSKINLRKAKNMAKAVEWCQITHDKIMNNDIVEAFMKFDKDGSGAIDKQELASLLKELGYVLSDFQLDEAMQDLDIDGNGVIDLNEFSRWYLTGMKGYNSGTLSDLKNSNLADVIISTFCDELVNEMKHDLKTKTHKLGFSFNDPKDDAGTQLDIAFHLVGATYNEWLIRMNQYEGTWNKDEERKKGHIINEDDRVKLTFEIVLGTFHNAEEHCEILEDAIYRILKTVKFENLIQPRVYDRDGKVIIGLQIHMPFNDDSKQMGLFKNGAHKHMKLPKNIQQLFTGIDQSLQFKLNTKTNFVEGLFGETTFEELIKGGFRVSLQAEIISNIKNTLTKKLQEKEFTRELGSVLEKLSPLFLMALTANVNIGFKNFELLKKFDQFKPVFEALNQTMADVIVKNHLTKTQTEDEDENKAEGEDENMVSIDVKDNKYDELQCPKDHKMEVKESKGYNFCDKCSTNIPSNEVFRRCNECDYDLCPKCILKTQQKPEDENKAEGEDENKAEGESENEGKRPAIAKGEVMRQENEHADFLHDSFKNENFGFNCLHYSVSEASGSLKVMVVNKKGQCGSVRVVTQDAEAKAGEDYEKVDTILSFDDGEKQKFVEVVIYDDDEWEPGEDFYMQLYEHPGDQELVGQDTKTRIGIIDDDKPGEIHFQEAKAVQALATAAECEVVIERRNGSDGVVTVDYVTLELYESEQTAFAGRHFEHAKGTLEFRQGETEKSIRITIINRDYAEQRNENFAVQLSNVTPAGAKLSKKSQIIVNIVTDDKNALGESELQCPKDHKMEVKESQGYNYCDKCGTNIPSNEVFRRCNECDYDLCPKCILKTQQKPEDENKAEEAGDDNKSEGGEKTEEEKKAEEEKKVEEEKRAEEEKKAEDEKKAEMSRENLATLEKHIKRDPDAHNKPFLKVHPTTSNSIKTDIDGYWFLYDILGVLEAANLEETGVIEVNILWPDFGILKTSLKAKSATKLLQLAISSIIDSSSMLSKIEKDNLISKHTTLLPGEPPVTVDDAASYGSADDYLWVPELDEDELSQIEPSSTLLKSQSQIEQPNELQQYRDVYVQQPNERVELGQIELQMTPDRGNETKGSKRATRKERLENKYSAGRRNQGSNENTIEKSNEQKQKWKYTFEQFELYIFKESSKTSKSFFERIEGKECYLVWMADAKEFHSARKTIETDNYRIGIKLNHEDGSRKIELATPKQYKEFKLFLHGIRRVLLCTLTVDMSCLDTDGRQSWVHTVSDGIQPQISLQDVHEGLSEKKFQLIYKVNKELCNK